MRSTVYASNIAIEWANDKPYDARIDAILRQTQIPKYCGK